MEYIEVYGDTIWTMSFRIVRCPLSGVPLYIIWGANFRGHCIGPGMFRNAKFLIPVEQHPLYVTIVFG